MHILTIKYHWQVLVTSLQMQNPHASLLHRNVVKKLAHLLFYILNFYDHFSFHYRKKCYMSCWTACFLICPFLCFTVPVYSSFIFVRSAKGWKSLSSGKVLVNYLRKKKKKKISETERLIELLWFLFLMYLSNICCPNPQIKRTQIFLKTS